ncbi:2-keto-4-pentenoate hydratase [Pigmentiphaga litoralis]|uniref:2-keto-4-pentenoate hydratase n=1 Tax=Pigmentiphaga litoralis TaxID=516702 RepID=UPI003B42AE60
MMTSTTPPTTGAFDPTPAAALLLSTWRDHGALQALPEAIRPRTLDEGYDVQDAVAALRKDAVAGWKLGVGSIGALKQGGLTRPLVGRVYEKLVYASDSVVSLPTGRPLTVECEIAFVLGQDIEPGKEPGRLSDTVAATRVTFELVLSRFQNRRAVGWPSFAADGVGFGALVVGPEVDTHGIDEIAQSMVVLANGVERARVAKGDDVTLPWESFRALVRHASERGYTLRAGQIITTGACAMPFDIAAGGLQLEARFDGKVLRATVGD